MVGNPQVIQALKDALSAERQLNMQYRQDWLSVKNLGANRTAKVLKGFGHDTHCFMKKLTNRILFLGGNPSGPIGPVSEADSLMLTFKAELALEMAIIQPYERSVQTCMNALDDASRNLFEHLLKYHQTGGGPVKHGHVLWLEQQIDLLGKTSEGDYILEMH